MYDPATTSVPQLFDDTVSGPAKRVRYAQIGAIATDRRQLILLLLCFCHYWLRPKKDGSAVQAGRARPQILRGNVCRMGIYFESKQIIAIDGLVNAELSSHAEIHAVNEDGHGAQPMTIPPERYLSTSSSAVHLDRRDIPDQR